MSDDEDLLFPYETDVADLIVERWNNEVTDADPDPVRRRASVHRGAGYLQSVTYPPHGSSRGEEGGSMRPEETIVYGYGTEGFPMRRVGSTDDTFVLGYYGRGLDVLGAASVLRLPSQRAGFVARKTAQGRTYTALVPGRVRTSKDAISNARDVGKRAISVGQKLLAAAKKVPVTTVRGAAPPRRSLSVPAKKTGKPRRLLSAAQLKKLAGYVIKGGRSLLAAADKQQKLVKADAAKRAAISRLTASKMGALARVSGAKVAALRPTAVRALAAGKLSAQPIAKAGMPRVAASRAAAVTARTTQAASRLSPTRLRGDFDELTDLLDGCGPEDAVEVLGTYFDGLVDEASEEILGQDEASDTDVLSDSELAALLSEAGEGAANDLSSIGPVPTMADARRKAGEYTPDREMGGRGGYQSDDTIYDSVNKKNLPQARTDDQGGDVVWYDGSRGWPYDGFTSFARAKAGSGNYSGWWFTGDDRSKNAGTVMAWVMRATPADLGVSQDSVTFKGQPWKDFVPGRGFPSNAFEVQHFGPHNDWGPIVGNWAGGGLPEWVKGLRWDYGSRRWFWPYDVAPPWATQAEDQLRYNALLLDYATRRKAAELEAANRALQDQIDAREAEVEAKRQAKEDAENQRRIDKEQQEAAHQAELQRVAEERELASLESYQLKQEEAEERQAARDEERLARMQQLEDERAARQEERDFATMQRLAEQEERELESLQRLAEQEERELESLQWLAEQEASYAEEPGYATEEYREDVEAENYEPVEQEAEVSMDPEVAAEFAASVDDSF